MSRSAERETETTGTRKNDLPGTSVKRSGRPVYSRGPIIVTLEILTFVTGVASIVALIISLSSLSNQIRTIQEARKDTCYLLRDLVRISTPPSEAKKATNFINSTPLRDCNKYATLENYH